MAEARALEPSVVVELPYQPLIDLWEEQPELLWKVIALLTRRLRNMDEALRLIQEREVAILVADFDADPAAVKALLHALKVAYPQILTVALTSAADASLLIDLINEVQVYRFLARPVNPLLLKEHVIAALNRYHTYKTSPGLLRAQKVEPERAPPPVSPGFFQRLRNLAGRLPFANNP